MDILTASFSKGSLNKNLGCEQAPIEILKLLSNIKAIEIPVFQDNIDKTSESIFNHVKNIKKGIIIGGGHSITYSAFKGFAFNTRNAGMIIFDAHPGLQDKSEINHNNYLHLLIEENILDTSRIVLIGTRNISAEEADYLAKKKILCFNMRKIIEIGIEDICNLIMEKAIEWGGIYISVDIDAVDPAFAPGAGFIEPAGLSSRELLYFISRFKRMKNFSILDLVEINPSKDTNGITASLGANIIKELV